MAKIFLGLAILFMLLSAVLGFLTKTKIANVKASLQTTNASLAATSQQLSKAQSNVKTAKAETASLSQQVQTSTQTAAAAQATIDADKKAQDDLNTQITAKQQQIDDLTKKLATASTSGTGSAVSPTAAADAQKLAELSIKLKEDQEVQRKLKEENSDLKGKVDDFQKARIGLSKEASARALSGEVLAVQPSWNFVIVSLGDRQGVTMNLPLIVKRGPTLVAKLRVTSVEPATSVADIVSSTVPQGMRVEPGDRVIYSAQ